MNARLRQITARRRSSRLALLCLVVLACLGGRAQAAVTVDDIPDLDLGVWTPGMGAVSVNESFCVHSDFFFGIFVVPWQARLDDLSGASTGSQFRLANTAGSGTVAFTAELTDLRDLSSEILAPGVLTPASFQGDRPSCPNGLNARLELTFDASGLEGAPAGVYEGDFQFFASRSGSDTDNFRVRIRIPEVVQVSDLDDIPLGTFGGVGDLVGSDSVCVYRNDVSTLYEVQALGQGAGSAFVLEQGAASLPFEVAYDDGSGFTDLTAGGAPIAASGADAVSTSCGGGNNGTLRVTVREADLLAAETGSYAGTLTLTVAPL